MRFYFFRFSLPQVLSSSVIGVFALGAAFGTYQWRVEHDYYGVCGCGPLRPETPIPWKRGHSTLWQGAAGDCSGAPLQPKSAAPSTPTPFLTCTSIGATKERNYPSWYAQERSRLNRYGAKPKRRSCQNIFLPNTPTSKSGLPRMYPFAPLVQHAHASQQPQINAAVVAKIEL
jgi:hypothetical protein